MSIVENNQNRPLSHRNSLLTIAVMTAVALVASGVIAYIANTTILGNIAGVKYIISMSVSGGLSTISVGALVITALIPYLKNKKKENPISPISVADSESLGTTPSSTETSHNYSKPIIESSLRSNYLSFIFPKTVTDIKNAQFLWGTCKPGKKALLDFGIALLKNENHSREQLDSLFTKFRKQKHFGFLKELWREGLIKSKNHAQDSHANRAYLKRIKKTLASKKLSSQTLSDSENAHLLSKYFEKIILSLLGISYVFTYISLSEWIYSNKEERDGLRKEGDFIECLNALDQTYADLLDPKEGFVQFLEAKSCFDDELNICTEYAPIKKIKAEYEKLRVNLQLIRSPFPSLVLITQSNLNGELSQIRQAVIRSHHFFSLFDKTLATIKAAQFLDETSSEYRKIIINSLKHIESHSEAFYPALEDEEKELALKLIPQTPFIFLKYYLDEVNSSFLFKLRDKKSIDIFIRDMQETYPHKAFPSAFTETLTLIYVTTCSTISYLALAKWAASHREERAILENQPEFLECLAALEQARSFIFDSQKTAGSFKSQTLAKSQGEIDSPYTPAIKIIELYTNLLENYQVIRAKNYHP